MECTYDYSLIVVEPDARRGERVNVGILVFRPDGLDVRILETRKAAFIASSNWDAYLRSFQANLSETFHETRSVERVREAASILSPQARLSEPGWFQARDADEYEANIKRIVTTLVARPKRSRKVHESTVASEIAASFKKADILGSPGEDLKSGRVIRNVDVDEGTGLYADFALQNGSLHIATTISFTTTNPHLGTSASKAVTMDRAKKTLGNTKAYCVYAVAPSRATEVREHVSLLKDYADGVFNWLDPEEQTGFKRLFLDAYRSNFPTGLERIMP